MDKFSPETRQMLHNYVQSCLDLEAASNYLARVVKSEESSEIENTKAIAVMERANLERTRQHKLVLGVLGCPKAATGEGSIGCSCPVLGCFRFTLAQYVEEILRKQ